VGMGGERMSKVVVAAVVVVLLVLGLPAACVSMMMLPHSLGHVLLQSPVSVAFH